MATNKHAIIRYEALDRCFSNKGKKFFIDDLIAYVSDALKDYTGTDSSISRRQLFKDIDFMRSEAGFRAPIGSIKEGKKTYYRYEDMSYTLAMQQINPVEAELLKTTLEMLGRFKGLPQFDYVQELALKLKKSFQLEDLEHSIYFDQNEYLRNLHLLGEILKLINQRQVLNITYRSFNQAEDEYVVIHPYFLKQYNKRWFLYGQCQGFDSWTSLALDRIQDITIEEDATFIPCNESPEDYFEDIIGVSKPIDAKCEFVKIKVNKSLWPYIDSKPLHPSQTVIDRAEAYTVIQLEIIPNYEFYAQILGFGAAIEVISPLLVREKTVRRVKDSLKNYY
ncbi:helix-turn-helix transcriptional regulator [Sphingobacterium tabacisoli]|uniref:Helix-turn-helix transcriptional regulator n=1 Tax=Sphingobacterium tabacisoli TaxID=2044855 RepID=A0ABW5L485_9SPHI|nr:WYL domain-containing protein [Sphingobacterium tabacisoli]